MRERWAHTNKGNPCPLCGNTSGWCSVDTDNDNYVTCKNCESAPIGWRMLKTTIDGGGVFTCEDRQFSKPYEPILEAEETFPAAPSGIRDATYRKLLAITTFPEAYKNDLLRRGLTDKEVEYGLLRGWWGGWEGGREVAVAGCTGVPGIHPETGATLYRNGMFLPAIRRVDGDSLLIGGQFYPRTWINYRADPKTFSEPQDLPKYLWISSAAVGGATARAYDTNELPLFLREATGTYHLSESVLNLCEGALKSGVAAIKHWHLSGNKSPWLGAAGGWFSENELRVAIDRYPNLQRIVLWPDAGSAANPHVAARYKNLHRTLMSMGGIGNLELMVADWGQLYDKAEPDPDELSDYQSVQLIPWEESFFAKKAEAVVDKVVEGGVVSSVEDAFLAAYIANQATQSGNFKDITHQYFMGTNSQEVWRIVQLEEACGRRVDFVVLKSRFADKPAMLEYLAAIEQLPSNSENIQIYSREISDAWGRRTIGHIAEQLTKETANREVEIEAMCRKAIDQIHTISTIGKIHTPTRLSTAVAETLAQMAALNEDSDQVIVSTGFSQLDRKVNGFRPGELIVLGARPGAGKSTLALNIAVNIAKANFATLFVSLEMSIRNLAQKALSAETKIWFRAIADATDINERHWGLLYNAIDTVESLDLFLETSTVKSAADIESMIEATEITCGKKCQVAIVDYLQLISMDAGKSDSMNYAVGKVTRELKALAIKRGISILVLSQLSRGVENRQDKRPILSDLRDSGSIEQDADKVLFLYRDDYYMKEKSEFPNQVEVEVAKNRNGETGTVRLHFNAATSKFTDFH